MIELTLDALRQNSEPQPHSGTYGNADTVGVHYASSPELHVDHDSTSSRLRPEPAACWRGFDCHRRSLLPFFESQYGLLLEPEGYTAATARRMEGR